jgi:hypothetical protein
MPKLRRLHKELVARNNVTEGIVYLEITRGAADRDFAYPESARPTVVAFTQNKPLIENPYAATGVKVITIPDLRWKRRDIKSTAMLAQAMGKQEAKLKGAYEAWMVEDGQVTEGTSSSAFILDAQGVVRTQPLGHHILPGVTRRAVLKLAALEGIGLEERPFTVAEALAAARGVHDRCLGLRAADCRDRWRSNRRRETWPDRAHLPQPLYRRSAQVLSGFCKIARLMKPNDMIRCYLSMAALLYWVVYNFDLGPLGPMVLNLAVQSWLKRARNRDALSGVRRRVAGFLAGFDPQPSLRAGERM